MSNSKPANLFTFACNQECNQKIKNFRQKKFKNFLFEILGYQHFFFCCIFVFFVFLLINCSYEWEKNCSREHWSSYQKRVCYASMDMMNLRISPSILSREVAYWLTTAQRIFFCRICDDGEVKSLEICVVRIVRASIRTALKQICLPWVSSMVWWIIKEPSNSKHVVRLAYSLSYR